MLLQVMCPVVVGLLPENAPMTQNWDISPPSCFKPSPHNPLISLNTRVGAGFLVWKVRWTPKNLNQASSPFKVFKKSRTVKIVGRSCTFSGWSLFHLWYAKCRHAISADSSSGQEDVGHFRLIDCCPSPQLQWCSNPSWNSFFQVENLWIIWQVWHKIIH